MDMSSGEWLSHVENEDPARMINEYEKMTTMMMKAQLNGEEGLNNCIEFDHTDFIMFDPNNSDSGLVSTHRQIKDHDHLHQEIMMMKSDDEMPAAATKSKSTGGDSKSKIISFGSSYDHDEEYYDMINKPKEVTHQKRMTKFKKSSTKVGGVGMSSSSREHVLAERKRREIMTQKFLDLSALIPHLNKTDKASILGDAAKYLKELEERVKLLEEQTAERTVESVVLVKKNKDSTLDAHSNSSSNENLEIEARALNNNVLIRIHCQKDKGLVQIILDEIEKLHLTTLNCSTAPFAGYAMNITIIAQMNDNLCMTMKDLVLHLKLALQQFLCLAN